MSTRLEGAGRLVLWYLRRDRLLAVGWTALLAVMCFASAAGTTDLYPTLTDRVAAARSINASPAVVALYGPIPDVGSLGQLAMTKTTVLYALFVAALSLVLVRRHTRGEEETGQLELVGGAVVGRDAPTAAALAEAVVVGAVLGLVSAAADVAGGLPVVGSLAFGAGWTGVALVGAGLASVTCQLSASARTCGALTVAVLGMLFAVRAVGDVTAPWLGWLSPFGWSTRLRAYGETRWWVLLLYVVVFLACSAAAFALR
jgi:ABC-2 type transport system permease protein